MMPKFLAWRTMTMNDIRREDYKKIKHMNKHELTEYLHRIYSRGYEAGMKAAKEEQAKAPAKQTEG